MKNDVSGVGKESPVHGQATSSVDRANEGHAGDTGAGAPIRIRRYANGKIRYQIDLGWVGGRRLRKACRSRDEATVLWEQFKTQRQTDHTRGSTFLQLSANVQRDLLSAHDLMAGKASLCAAATFYLNHALAFPAAPQYVPPLFECIENFIQSKKEKGSRQRTIEELHRRLKTSFATFQPAPDEPPLGQMLVSHIQPKHIRRYLQVSSANRRTRFNILTKISQLFIFATQQQWRLDNPLDSIIRQTPPEESPKIFSLSTIRAMLQAAPAFDLTPYMALSLFAGLAQSEILRLDWNEVHLSAHQVTIPKDISRHPKFGRRINELSINCVAWLKTCSKVQGPVCPVSQFWHRFRRFKTHLDLNEKKWPFNGLQNTFASYHFGRDHSDEKTASMLSISKAQVPRYFRQPVNPEDVPVFWNLTPP